MKVVIAKVDEVLFDGDAVSMTVPGSAGQMTVLGHHMPLITTLKAGEIRVLEAQGQEPRVFPTTNGVLEITRDGATVIL